MSSPGILFFVLYFLLRTTPVADYALSFIHLIFLINLISLISLISHISLITQAYALPINYIIYNLIPHALRGLCQKLMLSDCFMCCPFMDRDVYSADAPGSIPTLLTINSLAL